MGSVKGLRAAGAGGLASCIRGPKTYDHYMTHVFVQRPRQVWYNVYDTIAKAQAFALDLEQWLGFTNKIPRTSFHVDFVSLMKRSTSCP